MYVSVLWWNIHILDGTTVENKGKLILSDQHPFQPPLLLGSYSPLVEEVAMDHIKCRGFLWRQHGPRTLPVCTYHYNRAGTLDQQAVVLPLSLVAKWSHFYINILWVFIIILATEKLNVIMKNSSSVQYTKLIYNLTIYELTFNE